MAFKLEFGTDNAAFWNEDHTMNLCEVARILGDVARKLQNEDGKVMDLNGNKVGEWSLDLVYPFPEHYRITMTLPSIQIDVEALTEDEAQDKAFDLVETEVMNSLEHIIEGAEIWETEIVR